MKSLHRGLSIDGVLDVQGFLWDEGTQDEEAIAAVYSEATASSQMWANVIGLQDQREAEEYLDVSFRSAEPRSPRSKEVILQIFIATVAPRRRKPYTGNKEFICSRGRYSKLRY